MFAAEFVQLAQQRVPVRQHSPAIAQIVPRHRVPGWRIRRGLPMSIGLPCPLWLSLSGGGQMTVQARLDALKERHAALESRIADEDQRPRPDSETLTRLKI